MIPPSPILILGIGNVLLKDEGIGVHVVRSLRHAPLPEMIIIAIEPKDISMGTEPSPKLAAKIPYLVDMVMKEINEKIRSKN